MAAIPVNAAVLAAHNYNNEKPIIKNPRTSRRQKENNILDSDDYFGPYFN